MKKLDFVVGHKLPLDVLMQPIFLGGNRGAGKTFGAKKLFEAGHDAGAQCIAIAPVGKWWSLRLDKDGKHAGMTDVYVFGGKHGDVPLTAESGKLVAKLLVEKRIHAVIDVALMRKGERNRFLADFLEEFWLLKKIEDASLPVVVFLEEAHAIVPQKPQPEQARMLGAAEDLVREGRNHGVGIVLIDQRSAVVNKNVLALVEVIIAMRTIHHLDRNTYEDWCADKGDDTEWLTELKHLQSGEAFLYAPVLNIPVTKVKIGQLRTFDATATASIGDKIAKVGVLSAVDVSVLKESMAQVIVEAEKSNPALLKRQIAELEKKLLAKVSVLVPVETKQEKVVLKADITRLLGGIEKLNLIQVKFDTESKALRAEMALLGSTIHTAKIVDKPGRVFASPPGLMAIAKTPDGVVHARFAGRPPPRALPQQMGGIVERAYGETRLGRGAREMLKALACRNADGLRGKPLTKSQIGALSGLSSRSGTFGTYLSQLRTNDYIVEDGAGGIVITSAGLKVLGSDIPKVPATTEELIALWVSKFPRKVGEMLRELAGRSGSWVPKEELGNIVGITHTSGTFGTYLSMLRSNGLVDVQQGQVQVSPDLFL